MTLKPRLLVEGTSDAYIVKVTCEAHGLRDHGRHFDVKDVGGVEKLRPALRVAVRLEYPALGAVFDADVDPASRWTSMTGPLRSAYPDLPQQPVVGGLVLPPRPGRARLGLWMMPDNVRPGMLEDAFTGPDDPLFAHAARVVADLPERRFRHAHVAKAILHSWLAWQEEPGCSMGKAIQKRYVAPDRFAPFVQWLRRLFEVPVSSSGAPV